jgi:transposase
VYSPDYASGLITSFQNRLNEAQEAIEGLVISKRGRRNPKTLEQLHVRVGQVIEKYKVEDCFQVDCTQKIERYSVQAHKNRPEEEREKITLSLNIKRRQEFIQAKTNRLGWQVYASNAPAEVISTEKLIRDYRNEFRIEHLFNYMINRDVTLLPVYLKKEDRVKG